MVYDRECEEVKKRKYLRTEMLQLEIKEMRGCYTEQRRKFNKLLWEKKRNSCEWATRL